MFIRIKDHLIQISEIQCIQYYQNITGAKIIGLQVILKSSSHDKNIVQHLITYTSAEERNADYERICEEIAEKTKRRS